MAKVNKSKSVELFKDGPVYYVVLNAVSINEVFLKEFEEIIERLEKSKAEPSVVVTISSHRSIYCAGYNLPWFTANPLNKVFGLLKLSHILARFIKLGIPTMGCLNGHVVAGGVFMACAHDRLIMNAKNPKT